MDHPTAQHPIPYAVEESPAQLTASAASWGAIFAGAAAAAALSLIMLMLGTGLGLSSVSPWSHEGVGAATFGVSTILWISLTSLGASALGGYLAGRLRTRWVSVHTDEVFFRDTAHGLLTWAVATLATAALLTSAIGTIVHGGFQAGAAAAGSAAPTVVAATADGDGGAIGYFVDSLFRKAGDDGATPVPGEDRADLAPVAAPPDAVGILVNAIRKGALPADDSRYLAQIVATRTGLSRQDAEKRVNETYVRIQADLRAARQAADTARKASAYAALWFVVALLAGAFAASWSATYGGRRRDA